MLLRLAKGDGYSHDEAYSIVSAILDHRRVMEACDQQYHTPIEVIGRAEVMMMHDLEGDAEHGLITIDYNDRLKIARFKARVGRINERLGSAQVQRVRRLGRLIRYQRRSIAQIHRTTREMKNDKTKPFILKL